jgi:hypothetical protein
MAKPKRSQPKNYYQRAIDPFQLKLNLVEGSKEKLGLQTAFDEAQEIEDFEVADYKDPADYQSMTAPTINPSRPRAKKLAYSRTAQKLVVRFRDGKWWEYNEIPVDMWNDLKASNSTGRYLKNSGLDTHDNMGPFNPGEMPEEIRVLFNGN